MVCERKSGAVEGGGRIGHGRGNCGRGSALLPGQGKLIGSMASSGTGKRCEGLAVEL